MRISIRGARRTDRLLVRATSGLGLVVVVLGFMSATARASLILIDDSTPTITISVLTKDGGNLLSQIVGGKITMNQAVGAVGYVTVFKDTAGEYQHFTFTSIAKAASTTGTYSDLTEPNDPNKLSDRLVVLLTKDSFVDEVKFSSDVTPPASTAGATQEANSPGPETGQFQTLIVTKNPTTGNIVDTYQVKSLATPEPATLVTAVSGGLMGLLYHARRSRRRAS